jgi:hypothetical protein
VLQKTQRIRTLYATALRIPFHETSLQFARRHGFTLYKHDARRATRQRFEAERAAAREQIEASRPNGARAQPVEQGFADAIRRGADFFHTRWKTEAPATPCAADDAQHARLAAPR